ncbi:unnamed protein product, partial [Prorocentrum cordatum]
SSWLGAFSLPERTRADPRREEGDRFPLGFCSSDSLAVSNLERRMAPMLQRNRMTAIGLTARSTETGENPSIVNVLVEVEGELPLDDVQSLIADPDFGFTRYSRMSSRVDKTSCYVEIPDFDASAVVSEFTVCAEHKLHEQWMEDYVGLHGLGPLNHGEEDLPPWECNVAHNYKGGNTMLHFRFHHCLGDGHSFAMLIHGLSDEVRSRSKARAEAFSFLKLLAAFGSSVAYLLWLICGVVPVVFKIVRVLCGGRATSSLLKGALGREKSLATGREEYDLNVVKAAGKDRGNFTMNDIMLAAFVGGLRRWMVDRCGPDGVPPGETVCCSLPVNLRTSLEDTPMGNKIGAFMIDLPVGEADRDARLKQTAAAMNKVKRSPEASLGNLVAKLTSSLPEWVSRRLMDKITSRVECVFTNVRGFDETIHLKGHAVLKFVGFVPPPPGVCASRNGAHICMALWPGLLGRAPPGTRGGPARAPRAWRIHEIACPPARASVSRPPWPGYGHLRGSRGLHRGRLRQHLRQGVVLGLVRPGPAGRGLLERAGGVLRRGGPGSPPQLACDVAGGASVQDLLACCRTSRRRGFGSSSLLWTLSNQILAHQQNWLDVRSRS